MLATDCNLSLFFFAELFALYRSWRASSLKEMLFYASSSWIMTLFPIFVFLFFTKQTELFSRVVLGHLDYQHHHTAVCHGRLLF